MALQEGELAECRLVRRHNVTAAGLGPMAASKNLQLDKQSSVDRALWVQEARLDAIMGGMSHSMPSFRSGMRCYVAFAGGSLLFI
jgi:hypothetical protein